MFQMTYNLVKKMKSEVFFTEILLYRVLLLVGLFNIEVLLKNMPHAKL